MNRGLLQVLKGRLALLAPTVRCGTFSYEEGAGLDEDEVNVCQFFNACCLWQLKRSTLLIGTGESRPHVWCFVSLSLCR